MEREQILKLLAEFLNNATMGRASDVSPDDHLQDTVGLDSMGAVEFVSQIEEEFEFDEVSAEEIAKMKTLNDAADFVEARLSAS